MISLVRDCNPPLLEWSFREDLHHKGEKQSLLGEIMTKMFDAHRIESNRYSPKVELPPAHNPP